MNNKKGFTLIELLAVLIILAIIMLITIPIVYNIVKDSQNQTKEVSVKNYIDAVNKTLVASEMTDLFIENSAYNIMSNGNVCIGTLNNNICDGSILKMKLEGEKPTEGKLIVENNKVVNYFNVKFGDVYASLSGITNEKIVEN